MTECELLIDDVFKALRMVKVALAKKQMQIPSSGRGDVSGLELSSSPEIPLVISGYVDIPLDGQPTVWWLRVSRSGRSWLVERWFEQDDDHIVHRWENVVCRDSRELARELPQLADELLTFDPPCAHGDVS
jgi:hypothetical protein